MYMFIFLNIHLWPWGWWFRPLSVWFRHWQICERLSGVSPFYLWHPSTLASGMQIWLLPPQRPPKLGQLQGCMDPGGRADLYQCKVNNVWLVLLRRWQVFRLKNVKVKRFLFILSKKSPKRWIYHATIYVYKLNINFIIRIELLKRAKFLLLNL